MLAFLLAAGTLQAADDIYSEVSSSTPAVATGSTVDVSSPAAPAAPVEPFVSPLGVGKGHIVSGFGQRNPPGTNKIEQHDGVDYAIAAGAPVRAARSGKVIFAGFSTAYVSRTDKTEKSRLVIIQHADGRSSRYVHLNTLKVQPRQQVKAGDVIGTASESDEWTEPVLHFEIREPNGKPLDPEEVMSESAGS